MNTHQRFPADAQQGFTLVELLVGMALLGIVLSALVSFFIQSSRTAVQSSARAELQQETLMAQQLITGKLKEAWYIFPPGQSVTMTGSLLTRRPSGGNTWLVGTDPILAMVLPPRSASNSCDPAVDSEATTGATQNGCYRFLAYFPVKRRLWLEGTATQSWRNPGPDPQNAETWVLAEYRGHLPASFNPAVFPPSPLPPVPTGNTSNLLIDYVAPTTLTPDFTTTSNTYTMFTYGTANGATASLSNPVNRVTMNLAAVRKVGSKVMRLPDANGRYAISVVPANLGKR